MVLNRHNYEEFFLLYIDNELSATERNAVEVFVEQNADLKEELAMLQQTVFNADTVVFKNKNTLLKEDITALQQNLLLYLDNELTEADTLKMQQLLTTDTAANKEFTVLQQTQLKVDDTIVFADKKILYRKEQGKVVGFIWLRVAAAMLLGFGTWGVIKVLNISNKVPAAVAKKIETKVTPSTPINKNTITQQALQNNSVITSATTVSTATKQLVPQKNNNAPQKTAQQDLSTEKSNNSIAIEQQIKQPTNNLPKPSYEIINNTTSNKIETASVLQKEKAIEKVNSGNTTAVALTNEKLNTGAINGYALNTSFTQGDENAGTFTEEDNTKKTKIGGLLRRVKRLVERNTNVKTGNGIKVAGFDIAIK